MKKEKNLTENKDLINTFKKSKIRVHLNKNKLRSFSFYLFKFNKINFFKIFLKKNHVFFKVNFSKKFILNKVFLNNHSNLSKKPFINIILMFTN